MPSEPHLLRGRTMGLALLLLLAAAVAQGQGLGVFQPAPGGRAGPELDLSEAGLATRLARLLPRVQKLLGEPLTPTPRVRPVTSRRLAELLAEQQVLFRSGFEKAPSARRQASAAQVLGRDLSRVLMTQVIPGQNEILICPQVLRRNLQLLKLPGDQRAGRLVDLLLVHELMHLKQDHRYGLLALNMGARNEREAQALLAIIEGHAERRTLLLAPGLGLGSSIRAYRALRSPARFLPRASVQDPGARVIQSYLDFPYGEGERFWAQLIADLADLAAVDRVFLDPPLSPPEVTHPSQYRERWRSPISWTLIEEQLRLLLGSQDRVHLLPISRTGLEQLLQGAQVGKVQAALASWEGSTALVSVPTSDALGAEQRVVLASLCTDAAGARAYLEAALQAARARDDLLESSQGAVQVRDARYDALGAEDSHGAYYRKTVVSAAQETRVEVVLVTHGGTVLTVSRLTQRQDWKRPELIRLARRGIDLLANRGSLRPGLVRGFLRQVASGWHAGPMAVRLLEAFDPEEHEVASAWSTSHGRFLLRGLAPGTYLLEAGGGRRRVQVIEGRQTITRLAARAPGPRPLISVAGHLSFGSGAGDAQVFALKLFDLSRPGLIFHVQGSQGRFTIKLPIGARLQPGLVQADGVSYTDLLSQQVLVAPGRDMTFVLQRR